MDYTIRDEKDDIFFKYTPKKKDKKIFNKKPIKENPFRILKDINFN